MLINSYIVICITLICLSSHACHARALGNRLLSKKSDSLLEKVGVADDKYRMVKGSLNKDKEYTYDYKQMDSKFEGEKMQMQRLTKTISDHDTQANDHHQAVVTVAWHVPHKQTRHPQPRFNLDYEPPQTHPPSHN